MHHGLLRNTNADESWGSSRPRLRTVIIGIGGVARCIAQAIQQISRIELLAGSCRTQEKGEAFAREFSCRWYGDTREMLQREQPNFAIVTTPSGAHFEAVELCASFRIDVLCEKPLEISTAGIERMIQAADAGEITLGAIFPQRFNPVNRLVRDAAAAGRFGEIACISAIVPWWREDSYYAPTRWQGTLALDGGGALINQAIHTVDLMQWIVGASSPGLAPDENPVEEVFAYTGVRGHDAVLLEVEDTAAVIMRFRNGAIGQLTAATSMYPGSLRRLTVGGRDGSVEIMEDQLLRYDFRHAQPQDKEILERFSLKTMHAGGSGDPMAIVSNYHRGNIEAYVHALEADTIPEISGMEAAKAVAIIEACYESARKGRPVKPMQLSPQPVAQAGTQEP